MFAFTGWTVYNAVILKRDPAHPVPADVAPLIVKALKRATVNDVDPAPNSHVHGVERHLEKLGAVRFASRELGRSAWNLAAADVPQVALILATCEKSLRCSSVLDDAQNYTSALPRRPIHSRSLTLSRGIAASSRSHEQLRSQHVMHWSERMGNAMLRASQHLRDQAAALAPANLQSVDWVGACVPLAPPDVWPGVPELRDTVVAASHATDAVGGSSMSAGALVRVRP